MEPVTINLHWLDGTADGIQVATFSNWSGQAIAGPREQWKQVAEKAKGPIIYFLTGQDSLGEKTLYIGESENLKQRLARHVKEKQHWQYITVLMSNDGSLDKSSCLYLENHLIKKATHQGMTFLSANKKKSGAFLPDHRKGPMDVFLKKSLTFLPALGVTHFESTETQPENIKALTFKVKHIIAKGIQEQENFTVLAGSQAVIETSAAAYAKTIATKRKQLIKEGKLKTKDNYLLFTQDVPFSSPSMAGAIVSGRSCNGRAAWKN